MTDEYLDTRAEAPPAPESPGGALGTLADHHLPRTTAQFLLLLVGLLATNARAQEPIVPDALARTELPRVALHGETFAVGIRLDAPPGSPLREVVLVSTEGEFAASAEVGRLLSGGGTARAHVRLRSGEGRIGLAASEGDPMGRSGAAPATPSAIRSGSPSRERASPTTPGCSSTGAASRCGSALPAWDDST